MEICEPKTPGTLWVPPGVLWYSFTFYLLLSYFIIYFGNVISDLLLLIYTL